jgi:membrane-bound lytic murein transglycosylase A
MRLAPAFAALLLAGCAAPAAPDSSLPEPPPPGPAPVSALSLTRSTYTELPGWDAGRQDAALSAFRASCPRLARRGDDEPVGPPYAGLAGPWKRACADAEPLVAANPAAARAFFEARFLPVALAAPASATGLVTAYYEPEIEARRSPEPPFTEPLLRRPADLVVVEAPAYETYARGVREEVFLRAPGGALTLAPPRGAIRRDARPGDAFAYARLSDVVFLQIQGSGRLTFPDGTRLRAAYAATNGRPYASIARHLADAGVMPLDRASNANIKAWLDAASRADADRIVDRNERYVFFAPEPLDAESPGPRGAAGAPLTEGASVAVDPAWHVYGALYWIAPEGQAAPPPRLGVAQDTGAAITGPLRADLFFGTGETVGAAAARVRHQARWWALVPIEVADGLAPET